MCNPKQIKMEDNLNNLINNIKIQIKLYLSEVGKFTSYASTLNNQTKKIDLIMAHDNENDSSKMLKILQSSLENDI